MTEQNLIPTVPFGSQFWDKPFNQLVNAVNGLMGGVEPQHIANPADFMNGAAGGQTEAYVWPAGAYKLVLFSVSSFDGSKAANKTALQLPDNLAPIHPVTFDVSQDAVLMKNFNSNGLILWADSGAGLSSLTGHTVFVAKA